MLLKVKKRYKFLGIFLIPLFASIIYLVLFSKPLFETKAVFVLKNLNSTNMPNGGNLLSLFSRTNSGNYQDVAILENYILSPELLQKIDKKFNLRDFYESEKTDVFKRLSSDNVFEEFLSLYRKNIKIKYNEDSGIVDLYFYHYDNDEIVEIVDFILLESELFLNTLNQKKAKREMKFVSEQLLLKTNELNELEKEILLYQNDKELLDPELIVKNKMSILTTLMQKLIETKMELAVLKRTKGEKHVLYKNKVIELNELNEQIKNTNSELFKTTTNKNSPLNEELIHFNNLKNEYMFKKEIYVNGLMKMELSKLDTLKDAKFLEIIEKPIIPEMIYYPKSISFLFTIGLILLILYGIIEFLIGMIKEHRT